MKPKMLVCTCGDCKHWEIVTSVPIVPDFSLQSTLICMTCKEEFPIYIVVPEHDKLVWKEIEA